MFFSNKPIYSLVISIVAAFAFFYAGLSFAASNEEIIKARIDYMEIDIGNQWKVLGTFAKSGSGSLADVEKSARNIANLAKKIPTLFPKDTGRGNFPDDVTRALPAIWKEPEKFQKDVQKLVDESEKLANLAKEGNKDAVIALIGSSGSYARTKIGCAECHESFRGARAQK